ncbi:50S ribosomal protein L11 methyltransferase [Kaustia mangrovi]|uniref:Ribosomal protein L11 methyltransferase n=1 Tax=Kaustia mangrovi TaxID=2593653 RepID=A0A7S8C1Y8_9HYPH|nr:50S ribosomal protein L11 methyltransferase [Kaustia mangrovi]QPC41883.1 50S ribosomal protein L11 methyltransferase [Kaustia mangrovi]
MHTLTVSGLALDRARALSTLLEETVDPAPLAVTLLSENEADTLWRLEALYDTPPADSALESAIAGAEWTLDALPERDWVAESLKDLKPVAAGRFFVHGHHDRDKRPAGRIGIEIEAGLAFGTGHHATTLGCLLALDAILKRETPAPALDVGCGSGVLALAYARATKYPVIASDIDPVAVEQTVENARINGVGALVRARHATGLDDAVIRGAGPYGLIMANILARPLAALAGDMAALLGPGGHLVLSGLTVDQEAQVLGPYRALGLALRTRYRIDRWATLVLAG